MQSSPSEMTIRKTRRTQKRHVQEKSRTSARSGGTSSTIQSKYSCYLSDSSLYHFIYHSRHLILKFGFSARFAPHITVFWSVLAVCSLSKVFALPDAHVVYNEVVGEAGVLQRAVVPAAHRQSKHQDFGHAGD